MGKETAENVVSSDVLVDKNATQIRMPPRVDRTGQRYGRLVVVEWAYGGKWKCACDCGETTYVTSEKLASGHTKSCGCLQRESRGKALFKDRSGIRYGRLVAIRYIANRKWLCRCDCGNTIEVLGSSLENGNTKSCGCLRVDRQRALHTTHGRSKERLHMVWQGMLSRCNNKNHSSYGLYGGRGISVCDEWLDYTVFREWALKTGYDERASIGECTIDRINPNGNYEPGNCKWANMSVQCRNRRPYSAPGRMKPVEQIDENGNVIARYDGIKIAAEETGLNRGQISAVCRGQCKTTKGTRWRFADIEAEGTDD